MHVTPATNKNETSTNTWNTLKKCQDQGLMHACADAQAGQNSAHRWQHVRRPAPAAGSSTCLDAGPRCYLATGSKLLSSCQSSFAVNNMHMILRTKKGYQVNVGHCELPGVADYDISWPSNMACYSTCRSFCSFRVPPHTPTVLQLSS